MIAGKPRKGLFHPNLSRLPTQPVRSRNMLMDCHLFRRLCAELTPALAGCRLEKIRQPAADVTVFTLYGHGRKRYLLMKAGRKAPFLFLADHNVSGGLPPPASIMFLRKRLAGRRVIDTLTDWVERRLYLRFPAPEPRRDDGEGAAETGEERSGGIWLCLDLRAGARLLRHAPDKPAPPRWPLPGQWTDARGEDWRNWPVLTPALRRTLSALPPEEQAALLLDLEAGGGDLFLYEDEAGGRDLFAWPLPEAARRGKRLNERVLENALEAAALAGERRVLHELAERAGTERARPHLAEAARLGRLLAKLDREESRLARMRAAGDDALALQACLYLFNPEEKHAAVTLPTPVGAAETPDAGQVRRIALDPRLTVRENMEALFHTARRGRRGLALLAGRRAAVAAELVAAEQAAARARAGLEATRGPRPARTRGNAVRAGGPRQTTEARGAERRQGRDWPKNVQLFRSSDGFLIMRGRDAAGNAAVLKLAAPHDLWLHVGGGPGAHVIIRRDHAGQTVPETTLREAGALAILKSWKKDERSADVVRALAGHVHPLRGGRPGETRVDRYEEGLSVCPEPDLEQRLAVEI